MKIELPFLTGSVAAIALLLGACSPSAPDETDEGTIEETATEAEPAPAAETGETDTADAERQTREEMLAEYDAALEEARETSGSGSPALWTLSDEDTTIHLFGTVHLMRPDVEWRTDEFSEKFDAADLIVLELDMESEEGQKAVARDFMSRGFYGDGRTLSGQLSEEDRTALEDAIAPLNLPLAALDPMEPWMAAVNLSVLQLQADGFDPNAGIEQVLIADAREDGKEFAFLETAGDQGAIFDNLPEDTQKTYLYETAIMLDETSRMLDQVIEEWSDGDVEGLGVLVANPETEGGDGVYDALFVNRNAKWVPQIEDLLDEHEGTVFVAVGAGHLAGPDSVINMLRDKGYDIEGP
tara:strand:+ start:361 stop:1422 length:1062 start_codon:yes stop_codon:yes gene_type:complete